MGDLAGGMHAGIGAAGSMQAHRLLGDLGEGKLDPFLDRVGIGLDLPAAEGEAVVGNGELETHEDGCSRWARDGHPGDGATEWTANGVRIGGVGRKRKMLDAGMKLAEALRAGAIVGVLVMLPSCFLVKVPVETAGTVVGATVRVAEKTATTGVDVAGKAAEAAIEGRLPMTRKSIWTAFR